MSRFKFKCLLKCLRMNMQQITPDIIKLSAVKRKWAQVQKVKTYSISISGCCYLPSCFPCMILARKAHIRTFFSCSPFTDGLWDIPTNSKKINTYKTDIILGCFTDLNTTRYSETLTTIVTIFTLNIYCRFNILPCFICNYVSKPYFSILSVFIWTCYCCF